MLFKQASKDQSYLRLVLHGTPGAGKTWTSLKLAHYLEKLYGYGENSIVVLDTERGSVQKYADEVYNEDGDKFKFLTAGDDYLQGVYDPKKITSFVKEVEKAEKKILIIDSLSHFWNGNGGILDLIDQEGTRLKGNTFAAWKKGDPIYRDLVQCLTTAKAHVICTLRAKMEYAQKKNTDTNRLEVQRVGLAPEMRDHFVSEMDVEGVLDDAHNLVIGKTRCNSVDGKVYNKPGADFAKALYDWNSSGANKRDVFVELKNSLSAVKSKEELDKVANEIKQNKLFISSYELEELQTIYKNIKV